MKIFKPQFFMLGRKSNLQPLKMHILLHAEETLQWPHSTVMYKKIHLISSKNKIELIKTPV